MMTEQYKDSYQNKYREEIAQVHAPQSLIERTKAAMREEEKRLARAAVSGRGTAVEAIEMTYANDSRQSRKFSVRSLAYPLTAAAAVLILASVSLTMRGLKSGDMAPAADTAYSGSAENGAIYEKSADFDAGFAESVEEAAVETAEEAGDMVPAAGAAVTESAAAEAPAEDDAPAVNREHKTMSAANDMIQNQSATVGAEESEAEREEAAREKKEAVEDSLADMAADKDSIIMEEVEKKPAFCDLPDAKTYVYEEETFIVRNERAGWVAYVETENGAGYLFRGEMEDVDEFLEAASQSLAEIKARQNQ